MKLAKSPLKVFYSWQSDLPNETNRGAIRDALRGAKKNLKEKVDFTVDEATRDKPGSPNIPLTILEKIRTADVFVADVTTVTGRRAGKRPCPNPNVIFELGYAAAHLGWDRIVLLSNISISPLKDLPFDFDRHRAMTYEMTPPPSDQAKKALLNKIATAILEIAKHSPKRPRDYEGRSIESIQRDRDIANIEWALSQVHMPSLDQFIETMPDRIDTRIIHLRENFSGVVTNSLFYLSDPTLDELFRDLSATWGKMLQRDSHYRQTNNLYLQIWDGGPAGNDERVFRKLQKHRVRLAELQRQLLARVRKSYPEVDLDAANRKAWKQFKKAFA